MSEAQQLAGLLNSFTVGRPQASTLREAALRAALAQQDAQAVPQSCQSCGKDINNGKVRCALGRNCWVGQQSSNNAATTPPAQDATWNEYVETACALIKAADDAAAAGDYMLDSNDCIKVLRGQWNAPLANDCPPRPQPTQQESQKKHKPLFAEMIAQHPGLAEELVQQDAQVVSEDEIVAAWKSGMTVQYFVTIGHDDEWTDYTNPTPPDTSGTRLAWRVKPGQRSNAAPTPPSRRNNHDTDLLRATSGRQLQRG